MGTEYRKVNMYCEVVEFAADLDNINSFKFSGGEVHVKQAFRTKRLVARIRTSDDFMKLLLVADAHKRENGELFELILPYMPYARQDRVMERGEALSLKVFCDIINNVGFPKVYVGDPHSDVTLALLNNSKSVCVPDEYFFESYYVKLKEMSYSHKQEEDSIFKVVSFDNYVVVAPDAGAYKKLSKSFKKTPLIYAVKNRDTKTGYISKLSVHGYEDIDLTGKRLLVVDDICDGGRTFIMLAEALRNAGIDNPLELYVTHGIFSNGFDELFKHYDFIHTTDSFYQDSSNGRLKVIKYFDCE